jgi:hypothetical protein
MKPVTAKLVAALVQARMESDVADDILAVLKLHEGKSLTVRILPLLPGGPGIGGAERWRITHQGGMMTKIEEREYTRSQGSRGTSLLMSYSVKSVTIDTSFVVAHNPADFAGRLERNKSRRAALNNHGMQYALAMAMNAVRDARGALAQAEADMQRLTIGPEGEDGAFSADRFMFEQLAEGDSAKTKILLEAHGIKEEAGETRGGDDFLPFPTAAAAKKEARS